MKVTVNRPSTKTAGNSEASAKEIRDYCKRLFYAPDTPVPASLAGFTFMRVASCDDVRSRGDGLRASGPRQVDLVYRQFGDSIGAEETNESQPGLTLNGLSEKDEAAIESFHRILEDRSQSAVPNVPPGTSVMRTLS
jgi:hypothetical protein